MSEIAQRRSSPAQRGRLQTREAGLTEGAQSLATSVISIIPDAALRPLRHGAARRATSPAARVRRELP